jgi:hypothetical protein
VTTTTPAGVVTQQNEEFNGTLAQAMKLGVPMKCEWSSPEGTGESYVKGDDVYLKTQVQGRTGFMVRKGDCTYTWSQDQKQGVKFCDLEPTAAPEGTADDNDWVPDSGNYKAEGVDWKVEYKCRPDIFSGDRFELPAGVEFLDMAATLKGLTMPTQ